MSVFCLNNEANGDDQILMIYSALKHLKVSHTGSVCVACEGGGE